MKQSTSVWMLLKVVWGDWTDGDWSLNMEIPPFGKCLPGSFFFITHYRTTSQGEQTLLNGYILELSYMLGKEAGERERDGCREEKKKRMKNIKLFLSLALYLSSVSLLPSISFSLIFPLSHSKGGEKDNKM